MLGAIIGDIVGSAYEFDPTNDYNFELFAKGSDFTDDTVCTIAVADAILKGCWYGKSLHEWCRRYPNPKGGYGSRFAEWVKSDNPRPYDSFGNGSAMRVSPIGWWMTNIEVDEAAKVSAECTHGHPEGIKGAQAVARAILYCHDLRVRTQGEGITRERILKEGLYEAIRLYVDNPDEFYIDLEQYRNVFNETCQGTVPVALWIVLNSSGFVDALRRAVSLGADADTLGAIVGSIAEALWGIPEWLKAKAMSYLPQEMADVVRKFRSCLRKIRNLSKKYNLRYTPGRVNKFRAFIPDSYYGEMAWATQTTLFPEKFKNLDDCIPWGVEMSYFEQRAEKTGLPITLLFFLYRSVPGFMPHERTDAFDDML